MSRHPVVLTTLEEDLKNLGLLPEEGPEKAAPAGEPASNKASKSRNVGAMSDDPDEDGETGTDEAPGTPHQGADGSKMGPSGYAKPVPMKGGDKQEGGPRGASAVSEALNRLRGGRTQEESQSAVERAESLIESVRSIMGEIAESQRAESVKAFANVSVIAEMLSKGFAGFAVKYEDAELSEVSEALETLSDEASEIAQILDTEDEIDDDAVEAEFRHQMEALVSSLDHYSDIVEADEHLESETSVVAEEEDSDDDEDDKDDDAKDKSKKDDDEKDDDTKEESVSPGSKSDFDKARAALASRKAGTDASVKNPSSAGKSALDRLKAVHGESYMPYGKGKGSMVSKPGKAGKPTKESKK